MTANHQQNCGDWDSYKDEYCYKVIERPKSFYDAKNACFDLDESSLVSIRSHDEQEFLFSLLKDVYNVSYNVWLGIEYKLNEFKWTDSTSLKYTNWANDFPVNQSGYDCVQMMLNEPFNGKWFNVLCNDVRNYFVCQKKQLWMFDYFQKIFMEYRETVNSLTNKLNQLTEKVSELTPTGTIAYFANNTAPLGWLKANGQSVSRNTFDNLFGTIGTTFGSGDGSTTFTLPDLRGEFVRGYSDGRDIDKDRSFGSFQWGSSIPLAGYISNSPYRAGGDAWSSRWQFAGSVFDNGFEWSVIPGETRNGMRFPDDYFPNLIYYANAENQGNISNWSVLKGTRPRNIALLACIKY